MRIVVSARVARSPDAAWRWWTDYGAVGVRERLSHGGVPSTREVLARTDDRVVLRERGPLGIGRVDHEVVVHGKDRRLVERPIAGAPVAYVSTWTFAGDGGDGTRITREVDAAWPPPGRLNDVALPLARFAVERDLLGHVTDLEREVPP